MPITWEGSLDGTDLVIGIVVSRFNQLISQSLLDNAIECLKKHGVSDESIEVAWVPGSFELPCVARYMARSDRFKAVIALGAVIRGETPHFEYVANEAASGIARVSYETGVPVIFGVLTTDNMEQAVERSSGKNSKGHQSAFSAIEMANLIRSLEEGANMKSARARAGFR